MEHPYFIGISIPRKIAASLTEFRNKFGSCFWYPPNAMHLTLRHLGRTSDSKIEDIHYQLNHLTTPEFYLTLSGMGEFGHKRRAGGSFWVGVETNPQLTLLKQKINQALYRANFHEKAPRFIPHISIGRYKYLNDFEIAHYLSIGAGFKSPSFAVTEFHLYQSVGKYYQPQYDKIATYPLNHWDVPQTISP